MERKKTRDTHTDRSNEPLSRNLADKIDWANSVAELKLLREVNLKNWVDFVARVVDLTEPERNALYLDRTLRMKNEGGLLHQTFRSIFGDRITSAERKISRKCHDLAPQEETDSNV